MNPRRVLNATTTPSQQAQSKAQYDEADRSIEALDEWDILVDWWPTYEDEPDLIVFVQPA